MRETSRPPCTQRNPNGAVIVDQDMRACLGLIPTSSAVQSSDRTAERRVNFLRRRQSLICLLLCEGAMSGQNSTLLIAPAPYFQEEGKPACALVVMPTLGVISRGFEPFPGPAARPRCSKHPKNRVGCNCEVPTGRAAVSAKSLNGNGSMLGGRPF